MADNEHRVLKNNTFDEWRQKSNEVSFDVGDNALLDNTRLSDKVFNYTASAGQVHVKGNDTNGDTLVIQKLPDSFLDNTGGYIILEHGTTIPGAFVKDAVLTQASAYSATISSVVTVDNKSKILVKNSTGTFSTSTDLTVSSSTIAHAKVERLVSESFPKGSIRVKKAGVELTQDLTEAGFHIANHAGTINLTGGPTVDKVTEGITVYQASANQTTQAGVESSADWWGTVLHANATEIKVKSNNGTFNSGSNDDIRILGYAPGTAKVDTSNVSSFSVNDSSTLHTVELNNEASGSDAIVIITTDLVSAINELQDDIGTIESLDASLGTDVVTALNNIEAVFDASQKEISAGSNAFTINSGAFTINSDGDITLDADGGDIKLNDGPGASQYGSLTSSGTNLVIKSGSTTMLTGSGANATFAGNISLPDDGRVRFGTDPDLEIYHNGSNSFIREVGTGSLFVQSDNTIHLTNLASSATMASFTPSGAVNLYHNNQNKLQTKSDGVNINGELQADSLDIDGAGDISGNLAVGGNTTVGGNETITGNLTVNGTTVDINANAEVSGTTILSSTLSVSGTATLSAAATVGTTLGVAGVATFSDNASVAGNFSVNGTTTLGDDVNDDTGISGDLTVGVNADINGNLTIGSSNLNVQTAIEDLQTKVGNNLYTGNTGGLLDGSASVTVALNLIETEIGDHTSYETSNNNITYGGNTIAGALVSLNDGVKSNDTDISNLQSRNINTVNNGSGLSGGGNLSADRSLSVVVDNSSIEIPITGAGVQNKLRVKQGGITNAMLAGSIVNSKLSNSAITINSESISLGGSHTFNSDDFAEGGSNKYFTNERVDDRVADFLLAGNGLTKTEDDDDSGNDSLTLALDSTVAGAGLTYNSGVLAVEETGNSGITVNANDITVDGTVLRTNVNRTIAVGTTLTVSGSLDLSNASVTFPSGGSGSVQNVGTSFLMITAGQTEQGLKIDRSEISNSHTIDPAIQWDNAKTSDIGWEVVYPNGDDDAAVHSSLITFANAGQLVDGGTETGINVTHSSNNFNFAVQVDDSSIEVNSGNNKLQVKALGITNGMLAGSIPNNKLANSTISGKALGTNLSTLTGGTGVTLSGGYNGSSAKTISIGQSVGTSDSPTFHDLTVTGDLFVQGDNTILTTSTLSVEDKNITLNYGTGNTTATANGAGITIQDAQSASPSPIDATMLWNTSDGRFKFSHSISVASAGSDGAGHFIGNLVGDVKHGSSVVLDASTGVLTGSVTGSSSTVTGAAQTAITSVGSLTGLDVNGAVTISDNLSLDGSKKELRFYEGSNYVGFEAPDLTGDQIWALPAADGSSGQVLKTDGSGNLTFITLPTGDTYSTSVVSESGIKLRLTGSTGSTDDIEFAGSGGVSIARTNDSKITITGANTYTLPCTTTSALGGIKIGYTEAGKNYPVEVDGNCKAFVNVPWENTEYTEATGSAAGLMSIAHHDKLDGIAANAQVNVATNLSQTTATSQLTIASSTGTDIIIAEATGSIAGLMSTTHHDKLDGISANANNSTNNVTTNLSTTTSTTSVTVNSSDGTNATINEASGTAAGVMTVAHHNKLDGIAAGANNSTNNVTTDISITQTANTDTVKVNSSDGDDGTITAANSTNGSNGNAGIMTRAQAHKLSTISTNADVQTLTLKAPTASDSGANLTAGATLILTGTGATTTSRNSGIITINSTDTWVANTATIAGYVAAPGTNNANKVWKTSSNGTPSWQADANTNTFRTVKVDTNHDGTANATLGSTEELKLIPGTNISMAESGGSVTITSTAPNTTNWNFKTDDNATVNISAGETIDYIGGNNITTTNTGNDITFNNAISNVYDGFFVQNSNGTSKFTHSASGINDDIILREGSNISITDGGDDIAIINATNTTYTASTGLDLTGTAFSIESDLRGEVFQLGQSTSYYYLSTGNEHAWYNGGNIDMLLDSGGNLHVEADIIAFSTTISSDRKLKENIKVVDGALAKVCELEGVTFDWKKDGKASAGVIAQDVEKILPSAVSEVESLHDREDTHKVVDYNQLSALFIEAIKELKEENKLLKTEIESLKDINKGKG